MGSMVHDQGSRRTGWAVKGKSERRWKSGMDVIREGESV